MIDRQTIDRIKEAANIVEVVSEFVSLRKSGANYKGLCPFHSEKTPSFIVSPARGTCHCFGCGKGGNSVSFIMEHEQMTYPEALRWLARKYGIDVRERELSLQERQEQNERESMFIVNEWAAGYFERLLREDPDGVTVGMQYLRGRGFRDDVIRQFRIGFDVRNRHALAAAAKKEGYKEEYLQKTGLCYKTDDGHLIDRFADRVVFPWIGLSGKVVGFSARLLDARTKGVNQKYVNSPDSDIYHKERELFGIYQAKRAIAREDRVYMVEGQTDVISMFQCGIENVVANSGTALSTHQINMLHRFTSNITLLYDGDDAGLHAALRGTDMLLSEGMNVKVLFFPGGDDPDSFVRKHTASDFRKYIEDNQTDFVQFKVNTLLRRADDPQKRSEAIDSIVQSISVVPNQILRDTYLHDSAMRIGMSEGTLINRMNTLIRERRDGRAPQQGGAANRGVPTSVASQGAGGAQNGNSQSIERMIARLVVRKGGVVIYEDVEDEDGNRMDLTVAQYIYYNLSADNLELQTPLYRAILHEAVERSGDGGFRSEPYFLHHNDMDISRIAEELARDAYEVQAVKDGEETQVDREKVRQETEHLTLDFRMDYLDRRLKGLQSSIRQNASDPEALRSLMAEYSEMQQLRRELARKIGQNIVK